MEERCREWVPLGRRSARQPGPSSTPIFRRGNAYRPKTLDGVPRREFGSGVSASVAAMARVGQLLLQGGNWKGSQLVSSDCVHSLGVPAPGLAGLPVKTSFTPGASKHYGLLWW